MCRTQWKQLLTVPQTGDHIVQVYQDKDFLTEAVSRFICAGLQQGEAIVVIAKKSHWDLFAWRLENEGFNIDAAMQRGQLVSLDADATLAAFMKNGMPDWDCFQRQISTVLDGIPAQYKTVRAYGEMVDILWQQGEHDAADCLEQFWNDLAKTRSFSLLCAYYIDHLDPKAYGGPLERICKSHSHLISTDNHDAFGAAVNEASKTVLGAPMAGMVETLASVHRPQTQMPTAQATIFYLGKNMPKTAEKMLNHIRESTD